MTQTQPQLPKPVFAKRKKSSKRRRRTEIPSQPNSPAETSDEVEASKTQKLEVLAQRPASQRPASQHGLQRSQHIQTPRRPRSRVVRASNLPFPPAEQDRSSVDYSAQSLQRLRDAQTTLPPPASMMSKADTEIQNIRVPEPESEPKLELGKAKPEPEPKDMTQQSVSNLLPRRSKGAVSTRPEPFTEAWDPLAEPDDMVVDEEPDLAALPTLERQGSSSSHEGWEAAQLARGGGGVGRSVRGEEQDYTHIIRRTEESPPKKGDVARLRAVLKTARREWRTRETAAEEHADRAKQAIESSQEIVKDAEKEIEERRAVVSAYDDVLKVFRRVCESLRREKEAILGYREQLLKRLEKEANEVKVSLLGGEDEFGRSVPGRLGEVDDMPDSMEDVEGTDLNFDAEEMMDDVMNALTIWRQADEEGYKQGFGSQGGGRMIGRLGLGLRNVSWLGKIHDDVMKNAAIETGEVARLTAHEIRAWWQPRQTAGLRFWSDVVGSVLNGAHDAVRERFEWEIEACVTAGDPIEAETCLKRGLEAVRLGVDPGVAEGLQKLRKILDETVCEELEKEIGSIVTK